MAPLLHFRELADTETTVQRIAYVYHYQRADGALVFRYDNSTHYPSLPNAPHHKHDGDENTVVPANAPDLAAVLKEIEAHLPSSTQPESRP
ncbi:MAG: toxin-antitoxin system TumE family protein [Anaerolineales bacterium]